MDDRGMAFVDGEYVTPTNAKISVFDNGFSECDMVYDVTSTWKGQFFRLDDHVDRFLRSCEGVRLVCPYSAGEIKHILAECVHRGKVGEASYVDVILTRGLHRSWIGGHHAGSARHGRDLRGLRDPLRLDRALRAPGNGHDLHHRQDSPNSGRLCRRAIQECSLGRSEPGAVRGDRRRRAQRDPVHARGLSLGGGQVSISSGPKGGTLYTPGRNVLQGNYHAWPLSIWPRKRVLRWKEAIIRPRPCWTLTRHSSARPPAASCRWSGSTIGRCRTGRRDRFRPSLRKRYWEKREAGWLGTPVTDLIETAEVA